MRTRLGWVLLVFAVLTTACSSSTAGSGAVGGKQGLPARAYDVAIYLCGRVGVPTDACTAPTTAAQLSGLRAALRADKRVVDLRFLSAADQYRLARRVEPPAVGKYLRPGVLPASFLITVAHPKDAAAVVAAYRRRPGVGTANACTNRVVCEVASLRKARLVH